MSETDDRAEILEAGTIYRMAYGAVRNRLDRAYAYDLDSNRFADEIRAELARGELRLDPFVLGRRLGLEGEHGETIKEAVEDALAGRRPKW
jgi:hypothetical protein